MFLLVSHSFHALTPPSLRLGKGVVLFTAYQKWLLRLFGNGFPNAALNAAFTSAVFFGGAPTFSFAVIKTAACRPLSPYCAFFNLFI